MPVKEYYAHVTQDGRKQTVLEHLQGTAQRASTFASSFHAEEQGYLIGTLHDIGKYSSEFQRRLLEDGPRVDHAAAGAAECANRKQYHAAFCVAGHHSGLPNLGTADDHEEGTLLGRLHRARAGQIPDYSAWESQASVPKAEAPDFVGKSPLTDSFFIRMLYSCLVDADYLDTEAFMQPGLIRGDSVSMEALEAKLDTYIKTWFPPKNVLNENRCAILENCIEGSSQPQGLFTLTVPTGGGKTVSSLAFALKHARKHGLNRVIYVVPYTSIIEQTAETFRQILGSDHVLEHHSGVVYREADTEEASQLQLSTENWDMPVIVTTAVQFFESLFASKSSRCRKLHNIAKSVVIFDEAQMLPVPYLRPCIFAISELVKHYNVSAVLCTATQPALENCFREFLSNYNTVELCPKHLSEDPIFCRTNIQYGEILPWTEIADRMNTENQVLCIVNSRKNAQFVFSALKKEGRFHLSTLMIPTDRKSVLEEIRNRLKNGLPCRVVSTSLIEAGVDVDFPRVFREEAGLDSVIQAAGRCNREGKRETADSIVTVFRPETKAPAIFAMQIAAARAALRQNTDAASADSIHAYFEELFRLKGPEALDRNRVISQFNRNTFPFRSVAEQFHLIDSETVPVLVPIGEGANILKRLLNGEYSRDLMRSAAQYSINLFPQHAQQLQNTGAILSFAADAWYLSDLSLYSRETGLSLDIDSGSAMFI